MAFSLTREDVREELHRFAQNSMRQELEEFGTSLHRAICDELHHCSTAGRIGEFPGLHDEPYRVCMPEVVVHKQSTGNRSEADEELALKNMFVLSPEKGAVAAPDHQPPDLPGLLLNPGGTEASGPSSPHAFLQLSVPEKEVGTISGAPTTYVSRTPSRNTRDPTVSLSVMSRASSKRSYAQSQLHTPPQRSRRSSWLDGRSVELPTFLGIKSGHRKPSTERHCQSTTNWSRDERVVKESERWGVDPVREDSASCCTTTSTDNGVGQTTGPSFPSRVHAKLKAFAASFWFDCFAATLVSLNAIFIGVQTEFGARATADSEPQEFFAIDMLFCLAFTIEIFLRLLGTGCRKFVCGSDNKWNLFDVATVATQIYEEVEKSSGAGGNLSYLRVFRLRLLRLFRVLRIVRVFRFVRELRQLVCSIACSLQSLMWTIVLIVFMLYVVGVFFTQLVSNYMQGEDIAGDGSENQVALRKHFGSLGSSVISLFQAMSGGIDWYQLSGPLSDIHWSIQLFFSSYIAFAVLAMMNVVTGVFVDAALQSSTKDSEKDMASRLLEFCRASDSDGNGKLSLDELERHLAKPAFKDTLSNIGLNTIDTKNLFSLLDVDDDGEIDWEDMVLGCLRLRGPAKSVDVVTMMFDTKRSLWNLQNCYAEIARQLQESCCGRGQTEQLPSFRSPSLS